MNRSNILALILILILIIYFFNKNEYLIDTSGVPLLLEFAKGFIRDDKITKCKWSDPSNNIYNPLEDSCNICLYCTDISGNPIGKKLIKDSNGKPMIPPNCTNKIWYYKVGSCNM